ncbi:MAG: hypothetical protein HY543_03725, partial [Deltaproteobacteria bacterium]|nr:hypothetical protein [Deltaproteobacteria bacterium]
DADFYQARLRLQPTEWLRTELGRQFVSEGFSTELIDGLRATLVPARWLEATVYAGVPRSVERGDFNADDGLLTGLSLGLSGMERTSARLSAAWRKLDATQADWRQNDSLLLGAGASHRFGGSRAPTLYGLLEYDLSAKVTDTATVGADITPFERLSGTLEFDYFNVNRQTNRQTILGLIAQGPIWSGRVAATLTLIPDWIDLRASYGYYRMEVQPGAWRTGHLLDVTAPIRWGAIGLGVQPGYSYSSSFGGRLYGARLIAHEDFTPRLFADAGVHFTTYRKITRDNDIGVGSWLWAGYAVAKHLTVSAGAEYNTNNALNRDIRGGVRIRFHDKRAL